MAQNQVTPTAFARKYGVYPQDKDPNNLFWPYGKSGEIVLDSK